MTIWKVWQRKDREETAQGTRSSLGWEERRKITHRGKTLRAFRAYLDPLETTAYMQKEMQSQLEAFDVTMRTIRILEMLYRKGPMEIRVMASQMKCSRQNIKKILRAAAGARLGGAGKCGRGLLCRRMTGVCLWRSAAKRDEVGRWGSCC